MKFPLCFFAAILVFTQVLTAQTTSSRQLRENFSKEHLGLVLKLYHEGKRAEALAQLDRSFRLAKDELGHSGFFYSEVWSEAQIRSGATDEEWGLDVFLYLLRRGHGNDARSTRRLSGREYLLGGNILSKLRSVGRITEAREVNLIQQNSLRVHERLDTANRPYKDLGPLYDFLPAARKREFPIMYKDVFPETPPGIFIDYPRMYAVQYTAFAVLDTGDWVRAAELHRWFTDYTAKYSITGKPRGEEVVRNALHCYGALASICLMHGHPEAAIAEYDAFLAKSRQDNYPIYGPDPLSAKLSKMIIQIDHGTLPDNTIEVALEAATRMEKFTYYSRLRKFKAWTGLARIYHATGDRKRAWGLLDELAAKAKDDVNPHYQIALLYPMIDLALKEGGTHPELEGWLIRLLQFERSMGNKFNELPLYEKYAKFLTLNGRLSEAVQILQEAIRLSVAMNIPSREKQNRDALRQLLSARGLLAGRNEGPEKAGSAKGSPSSSPGGNSPAKPAPAAEDTRQVDVQPLSSHAMIVPDSTAHGRFYVTNPSSLEKTGSLQVVGPIVSEDWDEANDLSIEVDAAAPVKTMTHRLTLSPGASCVVDIKGEGGLKDIGTKVSCAWMELGKPVSDGIWIYQTSEIATRRAVIDAHAVKANPFYLVPIRHMIQRAGNDTERDRVDFKISASKPMRIEVYDQSGTKLICVDSNGDGDFQDKGDIIHRDLNGNQLPDITLEEGEGLASLVMYVGSGGSGPEVGKDPHEISISILEDGEWHLDAVDVIE